ncbi:hypothetical protein NIES21_14810 [Anabaenopsis circularis NIES-21]|uniref:Uncharacterized protein n=1 Tax=Anabaenopsis circularis NIES-21 TaxID=1085406 RepID=A0A1Z4GDR0_9CYAN|nr:hypothetical protein NIES21_14810 [Anabaenopsis circularis NIES-21]
MFLSHDNIPIQIRRGGLVGIDKTLALNSGITQFTFLPYHDLNLTAIALFGAVIFYHTPRCDRFGIGCKVLFILLRSSLKTFLSQS